MSLTPSNLRRLALASFVGVLTAWGCVLANAQTTPATEGAAALGIIRTPPASHAPQINSARIVGVRPGHPFFFHIAATGDRPMIFSAEGLPAGLILDSESGTITGELAAPGEHALSLHAKNALGSSDSTLKVVVGEAIELTPAMGWNSWNHYGKGISQEIVLENAKAMVETGLINHGWSYVNIDDGWQGTRGGDFHALQGNEKFPDIKSMCDRIHAMGLKFGLYSTPWTTSYADFPGTSSENPAGDWTKPASHEQHPHRNVLPWGMGRFHFASQDAKQWGAWGVDYLKYDWNPVELPETKEMYDALRASGRDIVLSLSNHMRIVNAYTVGKLANSWRTTGDIQASWSRMTELGFGQDGWHQFSGPAHWIDPDMLELANAEHGQPGLKPDEEYTHMTLWCLLSAPLLLGNDLSHMDAFTLGLLTNDEVIAVDQDPLGDQAVTAGIHFDKRICAKKMADGSVAVGLFNLGEQPSIPVMVKWSELGIEGPHKVRDLWRQKDLGSFDTQFTIPVASHGAEMIKITR